MAVTQIGIAHFSGLAADTKPTLNIGIGATFYETDSKRTFKYNGTDWNEQVSSGLEKITEGGNSGWAPIGQNRIYKDTIGAYSTDLSISNKGTVGAAGMAAFATGRNTYALGNFSSASGELTRAEASGSHAEGVRTTAKGSYGAHAEGSNTVAEGSYSHSEGVNTKAVGSHSHSEGKDTEAIGAGSHAEGDYGVSSGPASHIGGFGSSLTAHGTTSGQGTFLHQRIESTSGIKEVAGNYSAILGGIDNETTSSAERTVVIGGKGLVATQKDMVYLNGIKYEEKSTAHIDLMVNPEPGTFVYDTTKSKLVFYDGHLWQDVSTGVSGGLNLGPIDKATAPTSTPNAGDNYRATEDGDYPLFTPPTGGITGVTADDQIEYTGTAWVNAGGATTSHLALSDIGTNTHATIDSFITNTGTALSLKAPLASPAFTGTVTGIDKTMIGLSSVDDTADIDKPISTATQIGLDLKEDGLGIPAKDGDVLSSTVAGARSWKTADPPTGLEKITESGKSGWRLIGRTAATYGGIGNDAIDFSLSTGPGTNKGAKGDFSIATGKDVNGLGNYSFTHGENVDASGSYSHASGKGTPTNRILASGTNSFVHQEAATLSREVAAANSAVLGGKENVILARATNSVIVGGTQLIADRADTVFMNMLKLKTLMAPPAGLSERDAGLLYSVAVPGASPGHPPITKLYYWDGTKAYLMTP